MTGQTFHLLLVCLSSLRILLYGETSFKRLEREDGETQHQ